MIIIIIISWELCKRRKFEKWYMHKPEFVLENVTHKILWDFEKQITNSRPQKQIQFLLSNGFCHSNGSQSENKYQDLARELKKVVKHESNGHTNCIWCTWNDSQKPGDWEKWVSEEELRPSRLQQKSLRGQRKLAIIQTPMKNHQ